jgi:hypothetical protein
VCVCFCKCLAYDDIANRITHGSATNPVSWSDGQSIIKFIKKREFTIIKAHGDAGNAAKAIVIQRSYRSLMRERKFVHGFGTLLSLNNFLFIGSSLRDPDILSLLDEGKSLYEEDFGPHFAFLFDSEVDTIYILHTKSK